MPETKALVQLRRVKQKIVALVKQFVVRILALLMSILLT